MCRGCDNPPPALNMFAIASEPHVSDAMCACCHRMFLNTAHLHSYGRVAQDSKASWCPSTTYPTSSPLRPRSSRHTSWNHERPSGHPSLGGPLSASVSRCRRHSGEAGLRCGTSSSQVCVGKAVIGGLSGQVSPRATAHANGHNVIPHPNAPPPTGAKQRTARRKRPQVSQRTMQLVQGSQWHSHTSQNTPPWHPPAPGSHARPHSHARTDARHCHPPGSRPH